MSDTSAEVVLRAGSSFGRYEIVRRIGRGGMGAVFEGIHTELKKRVAIKALLPPMSENPDLRTRFVREGQAASRIRHPHVVDIYDVGELGGIPFLVMEYLEGEDLSQVLAREHKLSTEHAADLLLPVLAAIAAAHEEGVIHRDLKPANIFLARDRYGEISPKVLDFGISKLTNDRMQEELTGTGTIFGTPFYMSPEQALGGKSVDAKSDQYSLGVILYQCLTGKRPFEADSMYSILHSIVQGTFLLPRMVLPSIPEHVEDIILRAMAKQQAKRFDSVRDFGGAVLELASDRVRSRWAHAFEGTPNSPTAVGLLQPLPPRSQAAIETTVGPSPFAETVSPDPVPTISPQEAEPEPAPSLSPDRRASRPLWISALAGFSVLLLIGLAIGIYLRQPAAPAIVVEFVPPPAPKIETPAVVEPQPRPEPELVIEDPPPAAEEEREPVRPTEKKKRKKKVLTGSNNAPILE